ncbi:ABC transporter permease [Telmatospirillum sp. J64-1]|uniref:ABC transporter permease n=1 Tax=Telmatospirillum sp. J64-1 TaxID=2502183 RepID=UPI00115E23BE|nr:FtsX-like permease family protein [Telmatospirillum sp. J64-1]
MRFLPLALSLARRDMRGAPGSFWVLVAGIALGVAVMAAIVGLAGAVLDDLRTGARSSVGGDVSLRLFHNPATDQQRAFLQAAGDYSETAELRPLARRSDGSQPTLVELKGVDGAYPLYGHVLLDPASPLATALEERDGLWGAVVDQALLNRMDLSLGDHLRLGGILAEIRAVIQAEPDRSLRAFSLGPRVMIGLPALEQSGLAAPGAQVYWYNRLRLPPGTDTAAWIAGLEERFPDAGWRIVDAAQGVPGMERSTLIARALLMMVGLTVLLIGGIGIGSAASGHLARKATTIAILKSLGAPPKLVQGVYLAQVLGAALLGIGLGLAAGAVVPLAASLWLEDWMSPGIQWHALAVAAGFGLLTALLFCLWPLGRLREISPQRLFRQVVDRPAARSRPRMMALSTVTAALLLVLLFNASGMPALSLAFAVAAGLVVLAFLALGKGLAKLAGMLHSSWPPLRLALSNLSRPGGATAPMTMALGLSLTLLVALEMIRANAAHHMAATLPAQAPDLVFINLPPQPEGFDEAVGAVEGVQAVRRAPFLHARVTHLGDVPVHARPVPGDIAWVIRGDRGLSWAAHPPPETRLVAGAWWDADYAGPPLASVDAQAARRLGLSVGDELTLDLSGSPLRVQIANLRAMDWTGLGLDFPILLSPPQPPPAHTEVAAIWAAPESLDAIEQTVLHLFPESPPIRVAPVIATLGGLAERAGAALSAVSALTALGALMVLAGSLAASYRRRLTEAVLLKVLGLRPRQLIAASMLEFALLGLSASALALLLGSFAAYAVVVRLMPESGFFPLGGPLLLAGIAVATMALVGLALSQRILSRPSAPLLRRMAEM